MSYTREQRAANAAKAAAAAEAAAGSRPETPQPDQQTERPESDTTTRVQLRNDRRSQAEAEIEERHAKRSGAEETAETPPETPASPEPAPVAAAEPVETPAPAAPVAEAVPAPAVEMVTVKVDGESFEVPKSEVEEAGGIRAYQTFRAAHKRLKEVNDSLAETKRVQAAQTEALSRAMALAKQPPPAPEPTDDELIQAIRFGTLQEASAALAKVAARGRGPQVDQTQVVMQSAAINNYNTARRKFAMEFADITQDQILTDAALAQENKWVKSFAQDGQVNWSSLANLDFEDGFRRIGNQVRSAFGRQHQPATAPAAAGTAAPTVSTTSPPSAKEERKASIVNLPTAAQRATPPEEEKPPTHAQILNEELKARGRQPMF